MGSGHRHCDHVRPDCARLVAGSVVLYSTTMRTLAITAILSLPLAAQASPKVIGVGAALPGVTGMTVDGDDLWVGSGLGHAIFRVSLDGTYETFAETSSIDDLVVHDGTVFGTALINGSVIALDPATGIVTTVASGLAFPNPILADVDGSLIVGGGILGIPATCFLQRIDPTGALPPVDIVPPGSLCPNSMDWQADGRIVVPDWGLTKNLLAVDPDTGVTEILATGFESPISAKECEGSTYILDQRADGDDGGEIFEVLAGGVLLSVAKTKPNQDSIACRGDDLLVSSAEDGAVRLVIAGHTLPLTLPGNALPGGVVVDGSNLHSSGFFLSRIVHREIFPGFWLPIPSKTVHGSFEAPNPPYGFLSQDLSGDLMGGTWIAGRVSTMNIDTGEALSSTAVAGIVNQVVAPNGDVIQALLGPPGSVFNATTSTTIATGALISGLGVLSTGEVVWTDTAFGTLTIGGGTPIAVGPLPEGLAVTPEDTILVIITGTGALIEVDPVTEVISTLATDVFYDMTPSVTEGLPPNWLSILTPAVDGCDVYAWGFEQSSHVWSPSWKLYQIDRC